MRAVDHGPAAAPTYAWRFFFWSKIWLKFLKKCDKIWTEDLTCEGGNLRFRVSYTQSRGCQASRAAGDKRLQPSVCWHAADSSAHTSVKHQTPAVMSCFHFLQLNFIYTPLQTWSGAAVEGALGPFHQLIANFKDKRVCMSPVISLVPAHGNFSRDIW